MSCQTYPVSKPETSVSAEGPAGRIRVVAFLCNWCSYAGADKAGANQLPVPAELSVIRVMCSGRVEPTIILEAFQKGADGVMVLACHPGDCHYKEGNLRAFCRTELLQRMVAQLGVNPERLMLDYVSAAEADKFSIITTQFVERLHALSHTPANDNEEK
jgi:coenzyme F420-reducing hydrogenase delta subunit